MVLHSTELQAQFLKEHYNSKANTKDFRESRKFLRYQVKYTK